VDKPDVPWDAKAYAELRDSVENIPEGKMRDAALRRIEILDCGNPDKTLASCDPTAKPPHEVLDWQNRLAQASIDGAAYAKALATEFQSLVCANDANAIYILRGLLGVFPVRPRLSATGRKAREQIEFIMSEKCAVSASLTRRSFCKSSKTRLKHRRKTNKPATGPLPARPCALAKLTTPSPQNCAKMIQGVHAPELIAVT
jgi:hypothetical protein